MIRLLIATALSLAFVGSAEAGIFKARRTVQADAACAPAPAAVKAAPVAACAPATVSVTSTKTYRVKTRLVRVRSAGC